MCDITNNRILNYNKNVCLILHWIKSLASEIF